MTGRAILPASHLPELTALVLEQTNAGGQSTPYATDISGVTFLRSEPLKQPFQCMIKPALCITLQGKKAATFGIRLYEYGAGFGLVVTVEMPETGTISAASKTEP